MTATGTAARMAPESTSLKVVEPQTLSERINRLHDTIARRAFELFEGRGGFFGRDLEHWFEAESELLHPVHVSIAETDDALEVKAELPGFSPKELQISLESGRLIISGKKESSEEHKKGKVVYSERCSNEILRVVDLPAAVDATKATATLKNGVLSLGLPKTAKAKAAKVEVKAA